MKKIVITGASGGLGFAACSYFANHGYKVFALDLKPNTFDNNVTFIKTDLCDQNEINRTFNIVQAEGKIDVLLNLAGIYIMDAFSEIDETLLKKIIDVNLLAAWRINKTFLPIIKKDGKIINVTSELDGAKPLPFNGIYTMTKTALGSYADSLSAELALLNIHAIKVRPGAFATSLIDDSFGSMNIMKSKTILFGSQAEKFDRIMRKMSGKAHPPKLLAYKLFKIAENKHPKCCYTIKAGVLLRLYSFLPKSLGDRIIVKLLNS